MATSEYPPTISATRKLFGAIFIVGAVAIGTIWWWVTWGQRVRCENEHAAYVALKTLARAESVFRNNDRDLNGLHDYWTGDVSGLYSTQANGQPIALIPRAIAQADVAPLNPLVPKPIAYRGYYFVALDADESEEPPEPYRQDTDKKSGKVHHLKRFGFCAFPAGPETGNYALIINENYTYFQSGRGMITPPKNWPSDGDRRRKWSIPQ